MRGRPKLHPSPTICLHSQPATCVIQESHPARRRGHSAPARLDEPQQVPTRYRTGSAQAWDSRIPPAFGKDNALIRAHLGMDFTRACVKAVLDESVYTAPLLSRLFVSTAKCDRFIRNEFAEIPEAPGFSPRTVALLDMHGTIIHFSGNGVSTRAEQRAQFHLFAKTRVR
jgi:hypothetical protein